MQHALPAQLGTPCLVAAFAQPAMTNPCLVNSSPRHAHAGLSESLPVFPHVPAASVVLKLRNREANDIFFREMGELCAAIQVGSCVPQHKCGSCAPRYRWAQSPDSPARPPYLPRTTSTLPITPPCLLTPHHPKPLHLCQDLLTRTSPQLPPLADALLEVACQETGVKLGRERVLAGCRTALGAIHEGAWLAGRFCGGVEGSERRCITAAGTLLI